MCSFTHEKLKKLIDLITVMPPQDAEKNRGYKFPFLASEIFNCELNTVLEKFFEAPKPSETEKSTDEKTAGDDTADKTTNDGDGDSAKMVDSLDPDKDLSDFLDAEKKDDDGDVQP